MAGSDPVDTGSHLDQNSYSANTCRRLDIYWLEPAAASLARALSDRYMEADRAR